MYCISGKYSYIFVPSSHSEVTVLLFCPPGSKDRFRYVLSADYVARNDYILGRSVSDIWLKFAPYLRLNKIKTPDNQ